MSGENLTTWPAKPFYIKSKIKDQNWTLEAGALDADATKLFVKQFGPAPNQLWVAVDGGTEGRILFNAGTGKVMQYDVTSDGEAIDPVKMGDIAANSPGQAFRVESLGDPWRAINTQVDWERKLNIDHSDPAKGVILYKWDKGDNEKFQLVEDDGDIIFDSIVYDDPTDAPVYGTSRGIGFTVDNSGSTEDEPVKQTLEYSESSSSKFTNTKATMVSQQFTAGFGISGIVAEVLTLKADGSYTRTTSTTVTMSTEEAQTTTLTGTIEITRTVPAGKIYLFQIESTNGSFHANFTAKATFRSSIPHADEFPIVLTGNYLGSNTTKYTLVATDITNPPSDGHGTLVEKVPLSSHA